MNAEQSEEKVFERILKIDSLETLIEKLPVSPLLSSDPNNIGNFVVILSLAERILSCCN